MISLLTPLIIFFFLITSCIISFYLTTYNTTLFIDWEIYNIYSTPLNFSIIFDSYGIIFISTIIFISFNVLIFSKKYMSNDLFISRFTNLVCLFIFRIVLLVIFPNLFILLLGWDGLGISSFLLIIYFQNPSSLSAGILTSLINRIGDILLILSIRLMLNLGQWNITTIWTSSFSLYIILLILVASITKRAQIPFSSWLPAAIEAPTPVSALVHSSTLVTAGVFLLFRFYPFLSQFILFNKILLVFSSITILIARISASFQYDLKKIIALSTLSQLGLIILRLSILSPLFSFFHLITHAIFKALLFLCAGTIIYFISHTQDLRSVRNLNKIIPITASSILIANIALCGIPFLAGFFSKDLILEESFIRNLNILIFFFILLATGLTANYSFRIIYFLLWSPQLFFPFKNFLNNNIRFLIPISLISFRAIFIGSIINWIFLPPILLIIPITFKLLIPLVTFIGAVLPLILNNFQLIKKTIYTKFLYASSYIWFLTPLTTQNLLPFSIKYSTHVTIINDQGWVEITFNNLNIFKYIIYLYFSSINKTILIIFFFILPIIIFIYFNSLTLKQSIEAAFIEFFFKIY